MNHQVYIKNKPATFEYSIEDKLVAGIVLGGSEIKSIREGKVSFRDSFCLFIRNELWLKNLHIALYKFAGYCGHTPDADRKLLLQKKELKKWQNKVKEKGYSIIPLAVFVNEKGLAKIEIGLGKGKKIHDKRDTIKQREAERDLQRFMK